MNGVVGGGRRQQQYYYITMIYEEGSCLDKMTVLRD
jgi:hypothetical protein